MRAVFRHELRNYFHSMTAWLFCAFILCFVGIGALLYNIQSAVSNFEYVLSFVSVGLTVIVPVLTMKSLAEERKQKTDQLLYSLPLRGVHIVLGKFLALFVIFLIPMAITAVYPLIFSRFGEVYLPTSYGSLAAFILLGAALISAGLFISSLSDNVGLAVGISIPLFLFNYYSVTLANYVSMTSFGSLVAALILVLLLSFLISKVTGDANVGYIISIAGILLCGVLYFMDNTVFEDVIPDLMSKLSLFDHFDGFVDGVFDISSIVFFLTVTAFFLFLTVQSLEKRRYN